MSSMSGHRCHPIGWVLYSPDSLSFPDTSQIPYPFCLQSRIGTYKTVRAKSCQTRIQRIQDSPNLDQIRVLAFGYFFHSRLSLTLFARQHYPFSLELCDKTLESTTAMQNCTWPCKGHSPKACKFCLIASSRAANAAEIEAARPDSLLDVPECAAVERMWKMEDSHGQILALACR